jgi:hypothetical protein
MTLTASRPKRLAGGGPLERRVRPRCGATGADKPMSKAEIGTAGGTLRRQPQLEGLTRRVLSPTHARAP